jgi:phosphotriesterase-related protein
LTRRLPSERINSHLRVSSFQGAHRGFKEQTVKEASGQLRQRMTRRKALGFMGLGAAAGWLSPRAAAASEPSFARGAIIRTVLKDFPPSAFAGGPTLFHEHMSQSEAVSTLIRKQGGRGPDPNRDPVTGCPSGYWDGCPNLDFMVEELKRSRADGVACIVDGAHRDLGRDVGFLTQISRRSGVPIVASGGFYLDYSYPPELATMSEDQIAAGLIQDTVDDPLGAYGEVGSSDEMTPKEKKVFRAVAKAHLATNVPIFTHTANGKCAEEQLDIFESVGVKPEHVVIGHLGSMVDPDVKVHTAICRRGAFVGFDRQGGQADERNIPMIMKLLDAGYTNNIMISADFGVGAWPNWKQNGGPGITRALTVFVPKLRAAGVKEDTLHTILVDNPRRFLAFVPKKPRKS